MHTFRTVAAALTLVGFSAGALAQDVTVMISGGFRAALEKLTPQYEAKSGDRLILISGPSMGKTPQAIPARLARGEKADVVIMVGDALEKLEQDRRTAPGSRVELADSPVGMVVKAGSPVPDISTVPALRQTLLKAHSVAWSDSASGRYVEGALLHKLGIADRIKTKGHRVERIPVASEVAKGKYALGFQQVSELLPVPGVTFVGKLPEDVQYITRFAGAVTRSADHPQQGGALLAFLSSAEAASVITATGLQPVSAARDTAR
ncbi:substrate-binding domain-containing protein [Enterobacter pasteurii]